MVVYATGGWDENNAPHLYNGTVAVVKSSNNSMTLNRHITKQFRAMFPPWLPASVCGKLRKISAAAKRI